MATLSSLHALIERERRARDDAQLRLSRCERSAQRAHQQCEQLLAYRAEYEQRWASRFVHGGTVEIVHCYRGFMQRLEQALALQQQQGELADAHCAQARAALLESERRLASVRKLLERRAAELARVGAKREQQRNDEAAQRDRPAWRDPYPPH